MVNVGICWSILRIPQTAGALPSAYWPLAQIAVVTPSSATTRPCRIEQMQNKHGQPNGTIYAGGKTN